MEISLCTQDGKKNKFVVINNRLKYKKFNIQFKKCMSYQEYRHLFTTHFKCINSINQIIIIKMNPTEKDKHQKKRDDEKQQQSKQSSSQDDDDSDDDQYESDFIADQDQEDDYQAPYGRQYSGDEKAKSKRDKKREKRKNKEKKRKEQQESYDEDDLDLIDNDQKLTRLKKKKQPRRVEEYDDPEQEEDILDDDQIQPGQDQQSDDGEPFQVQQQSDSMSEIQEVIHMNKDIFDPADLKKLTIDDEDRQVTQLDLPERYINQLKYYSKTSKKSFNQVRETLEKQDKALQAEWIYFKLKTCGLLRQSFDQKDFKERIGKVLQCIHRQHLDIMYIYYYRKKIFADYLNLTILWKIHDFDEEWYSFREKQRKYIDLLQNYLSSYTEPPKQLIDFIKQCPQQKYLKYFEEFSLFALARWSPGQGSQHSKKQYKYSFISQMEQKGIPKALQQHSIFLSPHNLCFNLKKSHQERKPRTPELEPKLQFQRIFRSIGKHEDLEKYPLLANENLRFKTITKYLCYELFAYPQLRRILRQRYYKEVILSTYPTKKGNQDIDLYNQYFPVKRIKDKPIQTLRSQVWILALQAEKLDLIRVELRFKWELPNADRSERQSKERDPVYIQLAKNYYEIGSKASQIWNLLRKRILIGMLNQYFIPSFMKQIKEELTKQGQKQIINACCQKLRYQLNKGPSLKEGKQNKILAMVLQDTKLGVAFIDQSGKSLFSFQIIVANDQQLKRFVADESLLNSIKQYKPDMILIAANCKRAQTLRKQLRDPKLFSQPIFCAFGQYQVPRLVSKRKIIQGMIEQQSILQAISMARLKKNPMAEIISLWSEKLQQNGILSLNLHQYQGYINQRKLKDSLEKVIIEVVNLVGLDLNQVNRNQHFQNQLQFLSGLGPKKAFVFLQKLKEQSTEILNRKRIEEFVKGKIVQQNCSPFLKIQTSLHKVLFQKLQKQKKVIKEYEEINLLDMTRIPQQWYGPIIKKVTQNRKEKDTCLSEMRKIKHLAKLSEQNIYLHELFKNPQKIRGIEWRFKQNIYFDEELVKSEIMCRFRNPRDPEKVMENREIFFNLLRETPETLKRYMIMQVKVLSMKKNYLNVIIQENGLFGFIKLQSGKSQEQLESLYQKGITIKAVIIGFPFDQKTFRDQPSEQQELLKIQMALEFPHKDNDRHEGSSRHDCMGVCFPAIVKEIHPLIDLEKDRFDLRKQDKPIIEVKQEKIVPKNIKADYRRISHPKFKNISAVPAIQLMKQSQIGDFVIRPSSQGPQYLTITWLFFKGVIVHIKVKYEHKGMNSMNITYRIEDKDNRSYNSLQQIIDKCIKPMNILVQDVTSNRKFLNTSIEHIQNQVKRDMQSDSSHIYYYFGVSEDYPQYILLIYMYKDKKPIRELIKIKSSGLYFHQQQFSNIRDLIAWFKEHLKEKEYQKYVKNATQQIQKMK